MSEATSGTVSPADKVFPDIASLIRATNLRSPPYPLPLCRQRVERIGQQYAAALGHAFRNHDALFRRIEARQRRMQQERLAVVPCGIAGLRNHDESRP